MATNARLTLTKKNIAEVEKLMSDIADYFNGLWDISDTLIIPTIAIPCMPIYGTKFKEEVYEMLRIIEPRLPKHRDAYIVGYVIPGRSIIGRVQGDKIMAEYLKTSVDRLERSFPKQI